jgi:cold shock CspA family protein
MEKGQLNQFNAADGFGAIEPEDGKPDVRVFAAEIKEPVSLVRQRRVSYEVVYGAKGPEATDVHAV